MSVNSLGEKKTLVSVTCLGEERGTGQRTESIEAFLRTWSCPLD